MVYVSMYYEQSTVARRVALIMQLVDCMFYAWFDRIFYDVLGKRNNAK